MAIGIKTASVSVTSIATGIKYEHDFVTNITINDPRGNELTVSPQGKGQGIVYHSGTTSPIASDMVVRAMPNELLGFYVDAYNSEARFDVMIMDTRTGERYDLNNAILRTNPLNTTIAEGEDSLDQMLGFSCPPSGFAHTGAAA